MSMRNAYLVLALPFWRYAVAIEERPDLAALPYYRKAAALACYDECRALFPQRTILLLRRTFLGVVEVTYGS